MLRSHELYDFMETGFKDENLKKSDQPLRKKKKERCKGTVFHPISVGWRYTLKNICSEHGLWSMRDSVTEVYGSTIGDHVVKLQILRQKFETLSMKEKEIVQEYLVRLSTIVNQMKAYDEFPTNESIVSKDLRSL